ncbi:MAG: TPM domain-containing protein [Mucinivorans sp.]
MRYKSLFICGLLLSLLTVNISTGQNIPPRGTTLVNDVAGLFSPAQRAQLEDSLLSFDHKSSTQIAVVTVTDLEGYSAGDYALEVLRRWGVGQKGKDNGVVILIKPRNANGAGAVYISVGYGLEGVLPDAKTGRIIDNRMMGPLKQGDYFGAAMEGAMAVKAAATGEFTAQERAEEIEGYITLGVLLLMVVLIVIVANKNKGKGGSSGSSGSSGGGGWFVPPIILGGGGRSSGGGFGGFGSGGFGGFGGGSGGGGGAGRSF